MPRHWLETRIWLKKKSFHKADIFSLKNSTPVEQISITYIFDGFILQNTVPHALGIFWRVNVEAKTPPKTWIILPRKYLKYEMVWGILVHPFDNMFIVFISVSWTCFTNYVPPCDGSEWSIYMLIAQPYCSYITPHSCNALIHVIQFTIVFILSIQVIFFILFNLFHLIFLQPGLYQYENAHEARHFFQSTDEAEW